jgi:hypothetical protein
VDFITLYIVTDRVKSVKGKKQTRCNKIVIKSQEECHIAFYLIVVYNEQVIKILNFWRLQMKFNSIFVRNGKVYFSSQTRGKYIDLNHDVTEASRNRLNRLAHEGKVVSRLLSFGLVVFRRP